MNNRILVSITAVILGAGLIAAKLSTPRAANTERPTALVGTWVSTLGGDTLRLRENGTAQRRGFIFTPGDYAKWRVSVDSSTHAALLCVETSGIGTALCGPLMLAGNHMSFALHEYVRASLSQP